MTHQGAVLQSYNNELVKYMEDLCLQREALNKQIGQAEEEKHRVQDELSQLTKELESVCARLEGKMVAQEKLDKILAETELAYEKILDSTRMLLTVLKTEMGDLDETIALKSNKGEHAQIFGLQQTQH
ncbi:hypothetical protein JRQ81_018504 [Phrynocephalus forsythii]|uniref:Sjogren syndrome nuclear autoantigen 1 n=1 Tax=Phrynocephalus forsythii TaxID=171643 RepID=A0A9Q1AZN2_9SAUR|nr:hypothetical protein JRQ81_018504 [Phrynocephalus forsythii]